MILTVKLTDIKILPTRQRKVFDPKTIKELSEDIERNSNLQPPGIWWEAIDATVSSERSAPVPVLVWGERRFRAITMLAAAGKQYRAADGSLVPLGFINVMEFDPSADELQRKEAEYSENTVRVDLSWPDRVRALAEIHEMKKLRNASQTIMDTARELSAKTGVPVGAFTKSATASTDPSKMTTASIPVALLLSKHLNNPEVAKATNVSSAFAIVLRQEEQRATAALIEKRKARGLHTDALVELKLGDARKLMLDLKDKSIDLILVDPPYGINADTTNFSRMQVQKHSYSDDPASAREFMQFLMLESFRIAKDRANLFMFCDSKHYTWLFDVASRAAWSPFPTPIIWDKLSPGVAPWQDNGFSRSYEFIFFATKGRRGLVTTIRDVLQHKRVETNDRRHAAQKPESLIRQLIAVSTLPGDWILDPCVGSGTTLLAARALKRRAIGFEIDRDLYNGALSALSTVAPPQSQANEVSLHDQAQPAI